MWRLKTLSSRMNVCSTEEGKREIERGEGGEGVYCIGERVGTRLTTSAIDSEVRREQCPVYG